TEKNGGGGIHISPIGRFAAPSEAKNQLQSASHHQLPNTNYQLRPRAGTNSQDGSNEMGILYINTYVYVDMFS
ncbi:MAG TPA: hypothetical protein VNV14_09105, partial [Opitutaceae bacterium]|nr:hypothetical protein [Opitutaceae bacterium]